MAISAEQLNIILTAKDREFAKAMDANARRIERFAQKAQKDLAGAGDVFSKLAGAAQGLAAVAVIQQLGVAVKAAADRLGDLADAADSIGVTTTALQELRYAAMLSGVQQDTLQQALVVLSKNLGDAAMGGGAAKTSLDALGLSASQLSSVPLPDALNTIADKISAIENPMERATLAADLFGKAGVKMINMLSEGSAGLSALREEAHSMGVVINEDVIRQAQEAGDKLDAMSTVISSNLTVALMNLAPFLISAAQAIAGLTKAANDFLFLQTNADNAFASAATYAAGLNGEVKEVADAYSELGKAQLAFNKLDAESDYAILDPNRPEMAEAKKRLQEAKDNIVEVVAAHKEQKNAADNATVAITQQTNALAEQNDKLKSEIELQNMSAEERIKATAAKQQQTEIEKMLAAAQQGGIVVTDEQRTAIEELAAEHSRLYVALETSKIAQKGSSGAMSESKIKALEAKQALIEYEMQVGRLGLTLSEFKSISTTIQSSMEDAFMGIADGTMTAKDAFRSMASDIIKELYRVLVVQRLVGSFATSKTAGSGILGAIGGAFGIKGPAVTGSASGGALMAGQPSIVGEHGRELFVPSSAGRVLSVPQAKAAVGGGGNGVTVNQSISFGAGVSRAEIQAMLPKIVESTKAAVFDAQRRSVNGMGY